MIEKGKLNKVDILMLTIVASIILIPFGFSINNLIEKNKIKEHKSNSYLLHNKSKTFSVNLEKNKDDCEISNIAKEVRGGAFTGMKIPKYPNTCEFIFNEATSIHNKIGNKNKIINGVAIIKSGMLDRYYPLYLNNENLEYFFVSPFDINETNTENFNLKMKNAGIH